MADRSGAQVLLRRRSRLARWHGAVVARALRPVLAGVQRTRNDQFSALGAVSGAVVFLGDSITEGGEWSERFPDVRTSNRGISGETSQDILRRLDSAIDRSVAVFVLAGTNDLGFGSSPIEIANRLGAVLDGIRKRAPEALIHLQSIMPRQIAYAAEIVELNARLQRLAEKQSDVIYVDLWPSLATDEGRLRPEYTFDSLHLNGAGYQAWEQALLPHIQRFTEPAVHLNLTEGD